MVIKACRYIPGRLFFFGSESIMEIGMIGLGRMGSNMVRRLLKGGHQCVVFDVHAPSVEMLVKEGAAGSTQLPDFISKLAKPRAVWMMVPAGVVDQTIASLVPLLEPGDILIDGGNSHYHDDIRRANELKAKSIHYMDVGTSGGIWGAERGYCLMIGGDAEAVKKVEPVFATLAPGIAAAPRTPTREQSPISTSENGYLHCGPSGAGHFVKMVHNGIEYGLMASFAEGLNILKHANVGKQQRAVDAETTPLRNPEHFQYDLDLKEITELWRRGSVIESWLLDLTASAFAKSPTLSGFATQVADSGEGRWTISAAIEEGVPASVLTAALFERFTSRGEGAFAGQVMTAMRFAFGGHVTKPSAT
jgi:6-phosphogluconate dehydrogenase